MNTNTFYSGDLSAINQNQVAANDSNTREQDSLRNYLARLAQVGSEDRRTGAYERTQNRDADVRMALGRGAIDNTRLDITTRERLAHLRNAIDEKLGQGQLDVARYGIDTGAKTSADQIGLGKMQIDAQKSLQEMLGAQALKQIQATNLWGNPLTGRMGETAIGAMTDASAANTDAGAAASRANLMIPTAADELGTHGPWGHWEQTYLDSLNPGGDASVRSQLLSHVLKNMGADASKVQVGPGGTNFVPVIHPGLAPSLMSPKIQQINEEMTAKLNTWKTFPDPAARQAGVSNLLKSYKQTTGMDYVLPGGF